jgi:hypothetical protein
MRLLGVVFSEIFGLFFDDGLLAIGLMVWVLFCALILTRTNVAQSIEAPVLGLGCIGILLLSVVRRAGRG